MPLLLSTSQSDATEKDGEANVKVEIQEGELTHLRKNIRRKVSRTQQTESVRRARGVLLLLSYVSK